MEHKNTKKVRFTLRLPNHIHFKVSETAKESDASINETITRILDKELNKTG
jgi:predicted HicB family RNase H-like nuclease